MRRKRLLMLPFFLYAEAASHAAVSLIEPILLETKKDSDASVSFRDESVLCRRFSMRQKLHLMLPFLLETKATSHADVPLRGECVMSCCRFSYLMTSHADVLIDKSDISRLRSY